MVVEDVDVVQAEPLQRLVERGAQVLARAEVAVGARPHVPAGLGADDQLVAQAAEVLAQDPPEVGLRRAVRRAVVVRLVEVGDAEVEGAADDGALGLERAVVAEVPPEAERQQRQVQPAASAAAVGHALVAVGGRDVGVGHGPTLDSREGRLRRETALDVQDGQARKAAPDRVRAGRLALGERVHAGVVDCRP